jgi:hypothetical protein
MLIALALLAGLAVAACTPGVESASPTMNDLPVVSPESSIPVESMPAVSPDGSTIP